jgi:hypothetical protein
MAAPPNAVQGDCRAQLAPKVMGVGAGECLRRVGARARRGYSRDHRCQGPARNPFATSQLAVDHSGRARVAPSPPNLPLGDPLHYESMIQRICNAYTQRFP